MSTSSPHRIDGQLMPLDSHAKRFLQRVAATNPASPLELSVRDRRAALEQLLRIASRAEEVESIAERAVPGAEGPLQVRIYTPLHASEALLPGLIYFHGGGLVAGSLDSHDPICRALSNASGCRVIAIDYRLAPEARFPAAVEDGCAAARWVAQHLEDFGVEPERLGVCGDSAGATLAAVVSQSVGATGEVAFALQFLLCPILDFGACTDSRQRYGEGYFLDAQTLAHDLMHYLGPDADPADPRVSPLRAARFEHMPPTCIHTAEFDPLRDEGEAYAHRLRSAGVRVSYRCHPGMIHLFYGLGALIPYAAEAFRLMGTDIRAQLAQ